MGGTFVCHDRNMRMRRLADEVKPVSRAPRPDSPWRIISPFLVLTLLIPSFVLAYASTTDQGPWAPDGYFGPGTFTQTLVLLIPLAIWAASWLLAWEGDHDVLEPRVTLGLIAGGVGLVICAWLTLVLSLAEFGNALD